jgi:putative pre-16S rRNA nuclease
MPEGLPPQARRELLALAFDFGEKRIGVAAGDTLTRIAQPVGAVAAHGGRPDWPALERAVRDWQPRLLIVGVPYNMDGTEGRLTPVARAFGRELNRRFGLEVIEIDERLSSREAADRLRAQRASGERKRRVRREDIDAEAACVLLEQWLSES